MSMYDTFGREYTPTEERLREVFVGRKVAEIDFDAAMERGSLTLDDGTVVALAGNEGGCACSAGDYYLTELNGCDNIITNVKVDEDPSGDNYGCRTCTDYWCNDKTHDKPTGTYRIFVFADNRRINLATFEGSDGNGYYGTGYWIRVKAPEEASA